MLQETDVFPFEVWASDCTVSTGFGVNLLDILHPRNL